MLVKIKLVFMQETTFLFTHTRKSMNQYIVKSSVRSKTVYNRKHTNTSTSKHAIIDTIVSTKSTRYTL